MGDFKPTNHLHHEDGAFQEYVCLDVGYLTVLPDGELRVPQCCCSESSLMRDLDVDPMLTAPTLCAGLTAYKAVLKAGPKVGE